METGAAAPGQKNGAPEAPLVREMPRDPFLIYAFQNPYGHTSLQCGIFRQGHVDDPEFSLPVRVLPVHHDVDGPLPGKGEAGEHLPQFLPYPAFRFPVAPHQDILMHAVCDIVMDLMRAVRILLMAEPLLHQRRIPVRGHADDLLFIHIHESADLRPER